jgi:hypothetical protein
MADETIKVLVTPREDSPRNQILTTKGANEPNIQTVEMPWWLQVLVRASRAGLMALSGSFSGLNIYEVATGVDINPLLMALIGAGGAFISSALWNSLELTQKWDTSRPGMRG